MIKRLTIVMLTIILVIVSVTILVLELITMPICYIIYNRAFWFGESLLFKVLGLYSETIKLVENGFTE